MKLNLEVIFSRRNGTFENKNVLKEPLSFTCGIFDVDLRTEFKTGLAHSDLLGLYSSSNKNALMQVNMLHSRDCYSIILSWLKVVVVVCRYRLACAP
jgi:hypothetical protein